ncbi:hypothetical protein Pla108_26010 [Botrimarina colliarenosi]|uniref:Uncharacterized protein n=1 Tax=Botrimarina colliarenosi TaxID=2528001 RepID=A0A5C6ABS1_9BACT|nr:hypothetical protein [Botrimarina colliarenosi]TWT96827.1 hypothetical protein Pla108_26010 [Botrimarina colliarenosi]
MLPESYRRLWRRRLRRRPLLPWLGLILVAFNGLFILVVRTNDRLDFVRDSVFGIGVAQLGLASRWITYSRRLTWARLAVVMLVIPLLLAIAFPMERSNRLSLWASAVISVFFVVAATLLLLRIIPVAAAGIEHSVRWIAKRITCPHCGAPYAVPKPSQPELKGRRFRLTILGILRVTTTVAFITAIGVNTEIDRIYGGPKAAFGFLAFCAIFPAVVATYRRFRSKLLRVVATVAVVLVVSSLLSFPRTYLESLIFCSAIAVGSHVGLWLSQARPPATSLSKRPAPRQDLPHPP